MLGLGTRAQLGIGISIYLQDRFSNTAKRVDAQMKAMKKNQLSGMDQAARQYRDTSAGIAAGAGAISYGLLTAAQSGADFQHRINQIYILGEGKLGKTRTQLSSLAEEMAVKFGSQPTAVAAALLENVRAGVTGNLDEITRYQLAVSAAAGEAIEGEQGVAKGLLNIMNAMGISAGQTYNIMGQQVSGMERVSNAVLTTANTSMASVYDINEAMQYFANTAYTTNMTLEQSLALIAKLSQGGIRGTAAGTALNNMVTQMTKNVGEFMTPKKAKAWATAGIDPKQIEALIDQGRAYEAIAMIDEGVKHLELTEKLGVLNQLLNIRGSRGLVTAFTKGDTTLEGYRQGIIGGIGTDIAMRQSGKMVNDLAGDFAKFGSEFEKLKNQFVRSAEPVLRGLVQIGTRIIGAFSWVMDTSMGRVLTGIVTILAPLATILFAFRAAAITATFALRGLTMGARTGGFGSIMGGMLGNMGLPFGSYGGLRGKVKQNANGRWQMMKGQTASMGGKTYKGGQFLPGGNQLGSGLGASLAYGTQGLSGKVSSFVGKAGPLLGKVAGFGMKMLPVVGWVWTAVELLGGIKGLLADKEEDSPELQVYRSHLLKSMLGDNIYNARDSYKRVPNFTQNQVINIDGVKQSQQSISKQLEQDFNDQLNLNLTH